MARDRGDRQQRLEIDGVRELSGAAPRRSGHIEVGSFVAVAAMTGGELRVRDVAPDHLRMIRLVRAARRRDLIEGTVLRVPAAQKRASRRRHRRRHPKRDAPAGLSGRTSRRSRWCSPPV